MHATALYGFTGKDSSELSFHAGATIRVLKCVPEEPWWVGMLDGRIGDFPQSYVRLETTTPPAPLAAEDSAPLSPRERRMSSDGENRTRSRTLSAVEQKQRSQQRAVQEEIVSTERKYVENLRVIVQVFYDPMHKMAALGNAGLTGADVSAIFTTVQLLLQVRRLRNILQDSYSH